MSCPCIKGPSSTPCNDIANCRICWKFHCQGKWNLVWGGDGKLRADCPPQSLVQPINALSATQKIGNALAAAGRVATALATGQKVAVDKATQELRLAICLQCPSQQWNGVVCKACGCVGVFKSWLATEDCPLGHWPPQNKEDKGIPSNIEGQQTNN